MPRRTTVHNAKSTSPHSSSNAVNDVLGALSRKLASSQHIENAEYKQPIQVRKPSFSMEHLLPKKDKKHDDAHDRATRKEKTGSIITRPVLKSKDRTTSRNASRNASRNSSISGPVGKPTKPAHFEMIMESPPAILYGPTSTSSGAVVTGRLKLNVEDPSVAVTLTKFTMELQVTTTTKKPVSKECPKCASKQEVLQSWNFLSEAKTFYQQGDNQFPWSCMLKGNYPATTTSQLGSISYAFVVHAISKTGDKIDFEYPLKVQRAVHPGNDKASIRIFPPTNLTCRLVMPQVVHPIGKFPVQLTLSGVVEKKKESQTRWRLKKLIWRVEENCKVKSAPCDKHKDKVKEGKAIQHTEVRHLGNDDIKEGWKTDFDTLGGEISLDFEAQMTTKSTHKVCCDVDSQSGLEVKHNLVVELIVAEEFVPNRNTNIITPTGAARVLRMQFALIVTEREGMGISWENEMPPMYEDVPPSPPGYGSADRNDGAFGGAIIEDYNGPELESFDLERIPTSNPADPPIYRERAISNVINDSLPIRTGRRAYNSEDEIAAVPGPSQARQLRLTADELEEEPPQLQGRRDLEEDEGRNEEDYAVGTSGTASLEQTQGH